MSGTVIADMSPPSVGGFSKGKDYERGEIS